MADAGDTFVPIFQPHDSIQAGMIRTALENSDIPCYINNETASAVRFGGLGFGAAEMIVMVPKTQIEQAQAIIRELGFK